MLRANRWLGSLMLVGLLLGACRPIQAPAAQIAPTATTLRTPVPVPTTAPAPVADVTMDLKAETIASQALAGNLLGDPAERTVYVLLPSDYATSGKHYPVVYVMPWDGGYPSDNARGFKTATELLLRKGEIKEMIVVVPDGTNRLGGGYFMSSSTLGDYETYFTRDVVNYVDTHYRTLPTRDSRGLAGCSRGGTTSMRLGLKYPNLFSVVAATGGEWDYSLDVWPSDLEGVQKLKEMPTYISDLDKSGLTGWYVQMAAAVAPDPENPPFYCEMPFRIVGGRGEFVPEVIAKIVETDAAHEARRYLQQPFRLRGIRLQHGLNDEIMPTPMVRAFVKVLTDLGIDHEYVEVETDHCGGDWEAASLKYISDKLVFEKQ
jgi:hypothetical protein